MARLLDTNILIKYWKRKQLWKQPKNAIRRSAKELAELYEADGILTPIYIEMMVGTTSEKEVELTKEFLGELKILDEGRILADDWKHAERYAARVLRSGGRRQLGDCLIKAIADRLNYDVVSDDKFF